MRASYYHVRFYYFLQIRLVSAGTEAGSIELWVLITVTRSFSQRHLETSLVSDSTVLQLQNSTQQNVCVSAQRSPAQVVVKVCNILLHNCHDDISMYEAALLQ